MSKYIFDFGLGLACGGVCGALASFVYGVHEAYERQHNGRNSQ